MEKITDREISSFDIVIDPEFKALIPPLSQKEYQNLEQSILAEGCRDSLVSWNGVIIDGHNRHEICTKHNIPFGTKERLSAKIQ